MLNHYVHEVLQIEFMHNKVEILPNLCLELV